MSVGFWGFFPPSLKNVNVGHQLKGMEKSMEVIIRFIEVATISSP